MKTRLSCLLLPLGDKCILLPASAVAEVIPFEAPIQRVEGPSWLFGIVNWRGISVPLTALEKMDFPTAWDHFDQAIDRENKKKQSIALINRSQKVANGYPFFGILLEGVPKLHTVDESNIKIINQFAPPSLRGPVGPKQSSEKRAFSGLPRCARNDEKDARNQGERFLMQVKIQNDDGWIPHLDNLWAMIDALPKRLQWFEQIVL